MSRKIIIIIGCSNFDKETVVREHLEKIKDKDSVLLLQGKSVFNSIVETRCEENEIQFISCTEDYFLDYIKKNKSQIKDFLVFHPFIFGSKKTLNTLKIINSLGIVPNYPLK